MSLCSSLLGRSRPLSTVGTPPAASRRCHSLQIARSRSLTALVDAGKPRRSPRVPSAWDTRQRTKEPPALSLNLQCLPSVGMFKQVQGSPSELSTAPTAHEASKTAVTPTANQEMRG